MAVIIVVASPNPSENGGAPLDSTHHAPRAYGVEGSPTADAKHGRASEDRLDPRPSATGTCGSARAYSCPNTACAIS